ncbi:hypothetical protein BY996DRAFT_2247153 [Phakopsora pachyrhizi]|nr:hypothetical protein BY996DRAFT_2247153 [Phakopsora pachyrhizi]
MNFIRFIIFFVILHFIFLVRGEDSKTSKQQRRQIEPTNNCPAECHRLSTGTTSAGTSCPQTCAYSANAENLTNPTLVESIGNNTALTGITNLTASGSGANSTFLISSQNSTAGSLNSTSLINSTALGNSTAAKNTTTSTTNKGSTNKVRHYFFKKKEN